jgi:MFS transporter, DHA1 family, multidrug resistance protein
MLGPLFGGYAYQNHDWRWTIWVILWLSGGTLALTFFGLPETSADKILSDRASRMRQQTGNSKWRSAAERAGTLSFTDAVSIYMVRPFAMLVYDPIGEP